MMRSHQGSSAEAGVVRVRGGAAEPARDQVAVEAPLELRLGGKPTTVVMRTPGNDEELALGFLFTEGIIGRPGDVLRMVRPHQLKDDEEGNVLAIDLAPPPLAIGRGSGLQQRSFYASSSCGVCGKTSIASLAIHAPPVTSTLRVSSSTLRALPDRLRAAQEGFAATGGLHAAGLFDEAGRLIAAREDVGRHNAVDKVIGWALGAGRAPLADCALMVSGRASFEILQKAIVAGLPIVAAVSAPSSLAVELAERFGVTLIGFLRGDGMNVYSHAARVTP